MSSDYTTMPTEGQFIALWEYKGLLWSGNYLWIDGVLHSYEEGEGNDWEATKFPYKNQINIHYLRSK